MDAHHESFRQEFVKFFTTNPIRIVGLIGKYNKLKTTFYFTGIILISNI